jgi:hypothetical protein
VPDEVAERDVVRHLGQRGQPADGRVPAAEHAEVQRGDAEARDRTPDGGRPAREGAQPKERAA